MATARIAEAALHGRRVGFRLAARVLGVGGEKSGRFIRRGGKGGGGGAEAEWAWLARRERGGVGAAQVVGLVGGPAALEAVALVAGHPGRVFLGLDL